MRKGFLKYKEMRKYFPMYEEAVSHIWLCNCSILNFLIYEENFIFFFISVQRYTFFLADKEQQTEKWRKKRGKKIFFGLFVNMFACFLGSSCTVLITASILYADVNFTNILMSTIYPQEGCTAACSMWKGQCHEICQRNLRTFLASHQCLWQRWINCLRCQWLQWEFF